MKKNFSSSLFANALEGCKKAFISRVGLTLVMLCMVNFAFAQDLSSGVSAFTDVTAQVKNYFPVICNLILVICGIVGAYGGFIVYSKFNQGEQDLSKSILLWLGGPVFMAAAILLIKTFFSMS